MGLEAVTAIAAEARRIEQGAAQLAGQGPEAILAQPGSTSGGFVGLMAEAVRRVDAQEHGAEDKMAAVEAGESDDLVGAMLASQQANLSFSMLLQARNKLAGALDELIKLQL
jgi:flagellar hook-basal body complex protein FliE